MMSTLILQKEALGRRWSESRQRAGIRTRAFWLHAHTLTPSYNHPIRGRGLLPLPRARHVFGRQKWTLPFFISSPSSVLGTQWLLME